jgi:iron complex outermembrane receptor protein
MNLGQAHRQGIDYDVQWRHPTDMGRLLLALKGTFNLQAEFQGAPNTAYESDLGKYRAAHSAYTPRHLFMLTLGLEQSDWSVMSTMNYRSGNTEVAKLLDLNTGQYLDVPRKVPAFWTLDLGGRWQISRQLTLGSYLSNITDRAPPLRLQSAGILNGVDTRYANYYGRTLQLKAEYKF